MYTNFVEFKSYKIIYQKYASLYFAVCCDTSDNELGILSVCIHLLVVALDAHFGNVCELDLVFGFHRASMILDELVLGGEVLETSIPKIMDRMTAIEESMDAPR